MQSRLEEEVRKTSELQNQLASYARLLGTIEEKTRKFEQMQNETHTMAQSLEDAENSLKSQNQKLQTELSKVCKIKLKIVPISYSLP